jgi:hypothetical protein
MGLRDLGDDQGRAAATDAAAGNFKGGEFLASAHKVGSIFSVGIGNRSLAMMRACLPRKRRHQRFCIFM